MEQVRSALNLLMVLSMLLSLIAPIFDKSGLTLPDVAYDLGRSAPVSRTAPSTAATPPYRPGMAPAAGALAPAARLPALSPTTAHRGLGESLLPDWLESAAPAVEPTGDAPRARLGAALP